MSYSFIHAVRTRTRDANGIERITALGLRYLLNLPSRPTEHRLNLLTDRSIAVSPVLVHLHGSASRGYDFGQFFKPHSSARCDGAHDFILVRPQCPPGKEWTSPMLHMQLVGLLDELSRTLPIDSARVALSGASMGGDGVWALGASMPRRFKALVPICAGANLAAAAALQHVPIWCWHGIHDMVYPVDGADAMCAALKRVGNSRVRFTRLEHCVTPSTSPHAEAHAAWLEALHEDSELWSWLREQLMAPR